MPGPDLWRLHPSYDAFAAREPYFSVLAAPEYRRAHLTDEGTRAFFASGDALVDALFRRIELRLSPHFAPTAILEYGCGAGRLALPLARRAARRNGVLTAVDAAPAMVAATCEAARQRGIDNLRGQSAEDFFAGDAGFDFVNCYLVLQRLTPRMGLALLRHLLARIRPGGIGAFQFPCRIDASAPTRAARWIRQHVPGANAAANVLRGHPTAEPFFPCHAYPVDAVLRLVQEAAADAAHVVFEPHEGTESVVLLVEIPLDPKTGRRGRAIAAGGEAPATQTMSPGDAEAAGPSEADAGMIDVAAVIRRTSIDELNRLAEQYFSTLPDPDGQLSKPFANPAETPQLLADVATVIDGLRITRGLSVVEFGAGTGWFARFLTQLGCRVILVDVSPTALAMARSLYERMPVIGAQPAPEFLLSDGSRIDLPEASVDRIATLHAFHHVPNPDQVIAEFGRILKPGGIAAFAEPGPRHSRSAQSQFEMRTYGVIENDVDVHGLWRTARACGFESIELAVFHADPFRVSLDEYEDLLAGGETANRWTASTRVFLRNVRTFFLHRGGAAGGDSRTAVGLACEIHAAGPAQPIRPGERMELAVTVTNTGAARWLPSGVSPGGVSLGTHLFDEHGGLVEFEASVRPLTDPPREIAPGETVDGRVSVPPLAPGRYVLELDCVADRVMWFAQMGSRPVRLPIVVGQTTDASAESEPPGDGESP